MLIVILLLMICIIVNYENCRVRDQFKREIKVGDKVLVYGVNHMSLRTVKELLEDGMFTVEEDDNIMDYESYRGFKCVVVTEQIKYNLTNFPEKYI